MCGMRQPVCFGTRDQRPGHAQVLGLPMSHAERLQVLCSLPGLLHNQQAHHHYVHERHQSGCGAGQPTTCVKLRRQGREHTRLDGRGGGKGKRRASFFQPKQRARRPDGRWEGRARGRRSLSSQGKEHADLTVDGREGQEAGVLCPAKAKSVPNLITEKCKKRQAVLCAFRPSSRCEAGL